MNQRIYRSKPKGSNKRRQSPAAIRKAASVRLSATKKSKTSSKITEQASKPIPLTKRPPLPPDFTVEYTSDQN